MYKKPINFHCIWSAQLIQFRSSKSIRAKENIVCYSCNNHLFQERIIIY